MEPHLRLSPGQQRLTPEQGAEVRRFALERAQAHLSTEPVNEQEAEAFLRDAYQVAGLPPPTRIHWLDGPVQLVALFIPPNVWESIWYHVEDSVLDSVRHSIWDSSQGSVLASVLASVWTNVEASIEARLRDSLRDSIRHLVRHSIEAGVWTSVGTHVEANVRDSVWTSVVASVGDVIRDSIRAYYEAPRLAFYHFFDVYLTPNELHALAHFNELVSGYWLGKEVAVLVRRPHILSRDTAGRLHSATGKCLEYRDGWGFYAWHGIQVPEQVIMTPEALTREDFLNEPNVEMRRIIQERMGGRFVSELDGKVLDKGPRGTLYEVALPGDPERIARYVRVQDASTPREYFLRVPPTVRTAAEAVAWSFRLSVEAYDPAHET